MLDRRTPESRDQESRRADGSINRMPADSRFYERIVPLLLLALAGVTVALILFAAGVLLGLIPFV